MRQKDPARRQAGIVGIFVLILVLVIAVAGGAYYLGRVSTKLQSTKTQQPTQITPSPDPTANWRTYTNIRYKFQIGYPSRYGEPGLPGGLLSKPEDMVAKKDSGGPILFGGFSLWVGPFNGNLDQLIFRYPNNMALIWKDTKHYLVSKTEVIIGGRVGFKMKATPKDNFPEIKNSYYYGAYFIRDGTGYQIDAGPGYNEKEFDQILSTFKFTSQ